MNKHHFRVAVILPQILAAGFCLFSESSEADGINVRADSHAPIGVMGDHTHNKGEWMFSYRFMTMDMEDNRVGTSKVSTANVLQDYMVAPLSMKTDMNMFGMMYAPSDRWTLAAMLPLLGKKMDHVTRLGGMFTTQTSGIGDASFNGLYRLLNETNRKAHISIGFSAPTGSIDEDGLTPMGVTQLPYPMQLGSGTWDLRFGATLNLYSKHWSFGVQASAILRTGENDRDYRLGNEANASSWVAWLISPAISLSARLDYRSWGNIHGADPALNPNLVPTADPGLRGGKRLDLGLGVNLAGTEGGLLGHRLAFEYLLPLYQDLDGPQLQQNHMLYLGYQYSWGH